MWRKCRVLSVRWRPGLGRGARGSIGAARDAFGVPQRIGLALVPRSPRTCLCSCAHVVSIASSLSSPSPNATSSTDSPTSSMISSPAASASSVTTGSAVLTARGFHRARAILISRFASSLEILPSGLATRRGCVPCFPRSGQASVQQATSHHARIS